MKKKEREAIVIIRDEIENIVKYHNKNLTKKQYYVLSDSVDVLSILIQKNGIDILLGIDQVLKEKKL